MATQFSVAVRDGRANAVEIAVGITPVLRIRTGAQPATAATADSGTVLATLNLPSDWLTVSSAGAKALVGTWQDLAADAAGTAGHYRIYALDGTTCHIQGSVTATGGGGDMTVDNAVFAVGQKFDITTYGWTEPQA